MKYNYFEVFLIGKPDEPVRVTGTNHDAVVSEFRQMYGDDLDYVSQVTFANSYSVTENDKVSISPLTGYNPFVGARAAAIVEKEDDKKTININLGDEDDKAKEADKEPKEEGSEEERDQEPKPEGDVQIDKDSPDANGDGKVDAKDDLNKDGKVDAKDLKIAELEKDLRIKELEKGIEEYDDPAPEAKMKEAKRLRIKDRGDSFECLDETGKCVKSFPYDNKSTFAKSARYDAQRFAEKHYNKQLGEEVDHLEEKKAFIYAAAQAKKEGKKKFTFNGKEYPVTIKAQIGEAIEAALVDLVLNESKIDKDTMKMLKSLDADEVMMIIQGMPKKLQKAAKKALGIKEKVDGRTKAYKETVGRLTAKKEAKLQEADKGEEDEFHKDLDDLVHKTFGKSSDEVEENFAKDSVTAIKLIKKYHQTGKDKDAFAAIKHGWNFIKNPKIRSMIVNLVKKVSTEGGYPNWSDTVAYIKKNTGIDVSNVNENFAVLKRQNEDAEFDDTTDDEEGADTEVKVSESDNPCWAGYEMVGTKMKNGKEVPNCVPISEAGYNDAPKTKAELKKRHPNVETDVKNKESEDLVSPVVSEAYANYISLTNKK